MFATVASKIDNFSYKVLLAHALKSVLYQMNMDIKSLVLHISTSTNSTISGLVNSHALRKREHMAPVSTMLSFVHRMEAWQDEGPKHDLDRRAMDVYSSSRSGKEG